MHGRHQIRRLFAAAHENERAEIGEQRLALAFPQLLIEDRKPLRRRAHEATARTHCRQRLHVFRHHQQGQLIGDDAAQPTAELPALLHRVGKIPFHQLEKHTGQIRLRGGVDRHHTESAPLDQFLH